MVGIDSLPNELLPQLFDDCDVMEFFIRSRVSKRWRSAAACIIALVDTSTSTFPSDKALEAVSDNLYRIASLTLHHEDEGLLLWALSYDAAILSSLEISTGTFYRRRAHIPSNFLGGTVGTRHLTSVTLRNAVFAFAAPGTASFPSVRTVHIEHCQVAEGPYQGWAIPSNALDCIAAMFPRMERLTLNLFNRNFDRHYVLPTFAAEPPTEASAAVFARLLEFDGRSVGAQWSLLQHVSLQRIPTVMLRAKKMDRRAVEACVPEGPFRVLMDIDDDMRSAVELCSADNKIKRTLISRTEDAFSVELLSISIAAASWRIVALSVTSIAWEALLAVPAVGFPCLHTLRIDVPNDYWYHYEIHREAEDMQSLVMPSLRLLILHKTCAEADYTWWRSELEAFLVDILCEADKVTLALLGMSLIEDVEDEYKTAFLRELTGSSHDDWVDLSTNVLAGERQM
ncbi:hypothetical protein EXIGLDRAFT_773166 [Exidia glandulosa HHB12029]|uniref:F-box domain-containing protein n=1 Tax=Exidia glandulosa HHB12029 TaxID=1314781 RepID=A0A165EY36_EXIGL|nr:hypothetical protein EXIGLDRAFT_773166 [Exidia glandulosa HHB12029]